MLELTALIILGIITGVLAGLFGVGGGVIIVPILSIFFPYSLKEACGTSLGALLFPFGIFGFIIFRKQKLIDLKTAMFIAIGLFSGSLFGAISAVTLSSRSFDLAYAIFLSFVALRFTGIIKAKEHKLLDRNPLPILVLGFLSGILAGLFGVGGGALIIPGLIMIFGFKPRQAMATSLAALLPPVGLPGVFYYHSQNLLIWKPALIISLCMFIGTFFGAKITVNLADKDAKKYYGIFLAVVAVYFIYNLLQKT